MKRSETQTDGGIKSLIEAHDIESLLMVGQSAILPLLHTLGNRDQVLSQWAYQALKKFGERAVIPLTHALRHRSVFIRLRAARVLGEIGDDRAIQPLLATLQDDMPAMRVRAVRTLGDLRDERAIGPLIDLLDDRDRNVRHHAVNSLVAIGIPVLLPILQVLEDPTRDESARWKAAYIAGRLHDERVVTPLLVILRDSNQPSLVRRGAAVGLSQHRSSHIVAPLIEALSDHDGAVRASAAHALGEYARYTQEPDKRPVEPLIHTLMEDDDLRARWMAALALQFFYDERAFPVLSSLRHTTATSIEEKRIKEAVGFVVRNMRRAGRRRTANMTQRDGNVP